MPYHSCSPELADEKYTSVGEQISQDDRKSVGGRVQRGVQPWTEGRHQSEGHHVEVETSETVADVGLELSGHRGLVYVAGTNRKR